MPISDSDLPMLRSVAGVLRILMSLRNEPDGQTFVDKAIARLYTAIEFISVKIVQQKSHGNLVHVEPKLLYNAVSSVVSVGLHACRGEESSITSSSARKAMSNCALSTLSMVEFSLTHELRGGGTRSRLCGRICWRIASMVGRTITKPFSEVCLCGFVDAPNTRVIDDILPLYCR